MISKSLGGRKLVEGAGGVGLIEVVDGQYAVTRVDIVSASLVITGEAKVDPADTSAAIWRIRQDKTVGTEVVTEYAGAGLFNQKWDDRETLFPYNNPTSLNFNGVDQQGSIDSDPSIDFDGSEARSFSFWLRPRALSTHRDILTRSVGNEIYRIQWRTGQQLLFDIKKTAGSDELSLRTTGTLYPRDAWTHCVITYDGNKLNAGVTFYANAVEVTGRNLISDTLTGTLLPGEWTLANSSAVGGNQFDGHLDEIAVWGKELSQAEVTEIYNAGVPFDPLQHGAEPTLISLWPFNTSGNFPLALDRKGGNDITLINMSVASYETETP